MFFCYFVANKLSRSCEIHLADERSWINRSRSGIFYLFIYICNFRALKLKLELFLAPETALAAGDRSRACERSGKRSGAGRKSGGAERSVERA